MSPDDITVEVRSGLTLVGQIPTALLDVEFVVAWNAPGSWRVTLPAEHWLAEELVQPQGGIVVTVAGDVVLSGPWVSWVAEASPSDPAGTVVVEGTTDDVLLWKRAAYPDPANDATAQTAGYWTASGDAETVFKDLVSENLGADALSDRRVADLSVGTDLGRGAAVSVSARFQPVGDVLAGLAESAGLGFRIVQAGSGLVFDVFEPADRTGTVRLDVVNGTLASQSSEQHAPSTTRALVAGQGEGSARTIVERANPTAESVWGRWGRSETFIDQRQTDDSGELAQRGDEALAEGAGGVVLRVVPGSDETMRWPDDWQVGDLVGVVVTEGGSVVEVPTRVRSVTVLANRDGVVVGAGVDDPPSGRSLAARVEALEASVGAPVVRSYTPSLGNVTLGNGTITGWWQQVGGVVTATVRLVCGSSTSFTGNVTVGLPVDAASASEVTGHGYRTVGGTRGLWARTNSTNYVFVYHADDNSIVGSGTSFTDGSTFVVTVTYRL